MQKDKFFKDALDRYGHRSGLPGKLLLGRRSAASTVMPRSKARPSVATTTRPIEESVHGEYDLVTGRGRRRREALEGKAQVLRLSIQRGGLRPPPPRTTLLSRTDVKRRPQTLESGRVPAAPAAARRGASRRYRDASGGTSGRRWRPSRPPLWDKSRPWRCRRPAPVCSSLPGGARPAAARRGARTPGEIRGEVEAAMARLGDGFERGDLCRALGYEPHRSSLHRALREAREGGCPRGPAPGTRTARQPLPQDRQRTRGAEPALAGERLRSRRGTFPPKRGTSPRKGERLRRALERLPGALERSPL